MKLRIERLTPELWPALQELFGKNGACNGCWCMYWRIGPEYRRRAPEANREDLLQIVASGPPPGLLAFNDELPVGWCQLTPRESLPWLERSSSLRRIDDAAVWAISCFYVRKGYRRQGVTSALIAAAVRAAQSERVPAIEAYPLDASLTPSASFTGYLSTFVRAGFRVVGRNAPARPIVRCDLP